MVEDDLIAAIIADPEDHAARAVYADWLEERGDRRAELIRIEGEMWRRPIDLVRFRALLPRRDELRHGCDPQWIVLMARPSFGEIRRRVETLAELSGKTYELRPPLAIEQVEALEARIGCSLPDQYRRFVTELADGGCGPAYGIASMVDATTGDLATPFRLPTRVSELRRLSTTGAFAIAEIGCGSYYYLVMSGPDAGCIWLCGDRGWAPLQADGGWSDDEVVLRLPRSAKLEFIDWYVQWLDRSLWSIARATADRDDVFDRPPAQVTDVNLAGRGLTAVPDGLRRLTEVRRLHLEDNPIEQLPAWIGELTKLEWISLRGTALRELPEEIAELRALKRLSCFMAKSLTRLPESLGRMTWLDDLDLRYSAIEQLPASLGELTQLSELQIHNNPLTSLPASIGKLTKLRTLDLSFCRIRSLPDEIAELPDLTEINLRANELVELPPVIGRCRRLETVILVENKAIDLAGACRTLAQVPTLRRLSLSSMGLVRLPDEIGLLTQLERLSVGYNHLEGLPETITNLINLRELDYEGSGNAAAREQWNRIWEQMPALGMTDDNAEMLADVTIPDGTEVVAGVSFVKTWRLRNTGKTTWGRGYELTHIDGPDFGASGLDIAAAPGEEIDLSLEMIAVGEGLQRSSWQLTSPDGDAFGDEFWVEVVVRQR
jgi:uncharacterized protein (TIGR02996 family)